MRSIVLIVLLVLSSSAFAAPRAKIEKLMGYLPTDDGIIFQVGSGGCTHRGDIGFRVQRDNSSPFVTVTLVRTHPDLCLASLPMGIRLRFTYQEIGISPGESFVISNPSGIIRGGIWNRVMQENEPRR